MKALTFRILPTSSKVKQSMATIYDVSKLAGVSLATVSRVMNKNAPVSEKTREKVFNAMTELDYRPNAAAKSLASNQSRSVGVLVSELHGPFFGSLISEIEAAFRSEDIHVIIAAGHSNEEKEKEGIEFLASRQCDAVILFVEAVSDTYLSNLNKRNLPLVILGRDVPKIKKRCLDIDHTHGGYLATEHLIKNGHRNIGFISGPNWKLDSKKRLAGFKSALKAHSIETSANRVYVGNYHEDSGSEALDYFLNLPERITGVVCANDEMAAGLLLKARERNINVPDDLSVVGFDDAAFSHYLSPALTTVKFPIQSLAEAAASRVLTEVYNKDSEKTSGLGDITLELVQRSTVACKSS